MKGEFMKVTIYGLSKTAFQRVTTDLGVKWFQKSELDRDTKDCYDVYVSEAVILKSFCGVSFDKIWLDLAGAKSHIEAYEFYKVEIL